MIIERGSLISITGFVFAFLAAWAYTENYNLAEPARAEVQKVEKEIPMREWVMAQVKEAGIDEFQVWALINCESRWDPERTNVNYKGQLGVDRGLWQISDKFHPEVSNSCAYDYRCSTTAAIKILKKRGYKEWVCGQILGLK